MTYSTTQRDLYAVLGLAPNADGDAIRHAYRALARRLHPDVSVAPDAARQFAEISHAYAVLSDPAQRRRYDEQRAAPPARASAGAHRDPAPARRGVLRGRDVEVTAHIPLRAAIFGVECRVMVARREVCAICVGSGAARGGVSVRCPRCLGTGGTRTTGEECTRCLGSGVIGDPPCANCHGAGRKQGQTEIVVALPPNVEDGQRLVLKGDGDVGPRNGPRGDLVLRLVVDPDPVLRRRGLDVVMDLTLDADDAARGAAVAVPTIRGMKRLRIARGVRDGQTLRIARAGIRAPGHWWRRGDQIVIVHLAPPASGTAGG